MQDPDSNPVTVGFNALLKQLRTAAVDATDDAESDRVTQYRNTVRRLAERWAANQPAREPRQAKGE